jgi:prolyl oligopeptidase
MIPSPPPARRDAVVDVLHGIEVPDPYRWLEDGDCPDTAAWVVAQNERTHQALGSRPDRAAWHERLVALLGAAVSTGCHLAGDRLFALERRDGRPQFSLVVRSASDPAAPPRTLIDPAELSADGTVAIDWYHPSLDGSRVAYGVSEGGDERSVLHVLDVETGEVLADRIPETRAADVGWAHDTGSFLYTRYPEGDEYHRMVYEHRLGDDWHDDPLVWGELPTPEAWPSVMTSPDGRYALVHVLVGWSRTDIHLLDRATGSWTTVIEGVDALTALGFDGDRLLGTTTLEAKRGRVVTAPLTDPAAWTTLVPESDAVLDGAHPVEGGFLVRSTRSAIARLHHHTSGGALVGEVALPEPGSFAGFDSEAARPVAFFQLEGFTRPSSILRWTPQHGIEPWSVAEAAVDPSRFTVRQVRYPSADGTEIGLFLVHRADLSPGVHTPCILSGYGGFAIASTPAWSPMVAAWCEAGGLFAMAGLRGGYEEGEAWHHAGRRDKKQNVFDDFHAAADFLVESGLTSRARLALRGGSNGGLLMGAAITQQPQLARAVHCAVPLLDMVRYPQFLIARLWTDEYGDPEKADEFAWLWAYSPYHHVHEGTCYPAVLFTAAEGDTRVDALHARKMAAVVQWATSCGDERPVLLRQESKAGHGVGKPLHKQADEAADVLAFFTWQLGAPGPA